MKSASRESILGRIREALRVEAPRPHDHTAHEVDLPVLEPQPQDASQWLPAVGESFDEQLSLLTKNSADLQTELKVADGEMNWVAQLRELAIAHEWKRLAAHRTPLAERAAAALDLPTLWTDDGYDVNELEKCDVGISGCDALVAQTGSVLVTGRSAGGRALSILPPHHLVLATRDQLIATVPDAFALLQNRYGDRIPSFISLITGPSRTGDIERILVLGAHGPRKLTILLS